MKIENVNDIIAFVKEAIKRQYYVYTYTGSSNKKSISIKIANENDILIEINIFIERECICIVSYCDDCSISGEYCINYKIDDREEAHLNLLVADIMDYRKKRAMKDVATFFDNYDENKKLAQNINNLDDDEE